MSTVTMRSRAAGTARDSDEEGSTVWFWLLVLGALLLTGLAVAWLGGWIWAGTDPRVAEIRALQEEARATYAANGGPTTPAEVTAAMAAMGSIREKIEALPEHLRPQVERSGRSMMRDAFRARIDAYFAAPPDQRRAELDRQIDQEEMFRKAMDVRDTVANAVGGGQGGAGRPGGDGGGRGDGAGRQGGNDGGGGPPRGGSDAERMQWRKRMLDNTTPEQRARYAEYRQAMEKRREERGLEPRRGP